MSHGGKRDQDVGDLPSSIVLLNTHWNVDLVLDDRSDLEDQINTQKIQRIQKIKGELITLPESSLGQRKSSASFPADRSQW